MSLINQLLRDLDKRRSRQTEDLQLPRGVRATTGAARKNIASPRVWWLVLLVLPIAAALYLWQPDSRLASGLGGLLAGVRDGSPAPANSAAISGITQAEVEAALMIPVFQLSNELATLPKESRGALGVDTRGVTPINNREASKPSRRNGSHSEKTAIAPKHVSIARPVAETVADKRTEEAAGAVAAPMVETIPTASVKRVADTTTQPDNRQSDDLEEVVIPAGSPVSPIEKQTRQLTAYERAENDFRKGVASLRQGRMSGAEEYFRSAIEEDRSHVAARQALIGILIEGGRNADAEEVLTEALSINPRQPREAMVLARLQVERGDLQTAIRTLESISAYAGSDAGYYSFLAAVLQRASRHEEAAQQFRNALALMPRNAVWMMGLGISLRALGDNDGAKDAFRGAAGTGTLSPELQAFVTRQFTELRVAEK
jgi:MSHA biogenesis protein MshN